MRVLAGEHVETFQSSPPVEEKVFGYSPLPSGANERDQNSVISPQFPSAQTLAGNLQTNVDTAEFSTEETARLVERCRANGTTVHSLICAVAACFVPASGEEIVRITCPFDLRKSAGIDDGACGVFIGAGSVEAKFNENTSVWHNARQMGSSLRMVRSPKAAINFMSRMSAEFFPTTPVEKFLAFFSSETQSALVVSNLGVLPIAERYGPYIVKAVWGPAMLTNLPEDRQTIGICTFGRQLRIVHQSYVPIRGLALAIRNAVVAACCLDANGLSAGGRSISTRL
jgi:hypothetical protein